MGDRRWPVASGNTFDADAQGGSQGRAFSAGPLVGAVPTKGSAVALGPPHTHTG